MANVIKQFVAIEFDDLKVVAGLGDNMFIQGYSANATFAHAGDMHKHIYFEIFFVADKPLTIITNDGKQDFVNKVVVVPPNIQHCIVSNEAPVYRINVFESDGQFARPNKHIASIDRDKISVVPFNENFDFYFKKLIESESKPKTIRVKRESLVRLILLELFELLPLRENNEKRKKGEGNYSYLEQIDSFVNVHYTGNEAKLENLAKELFLSEKQVSRIIKKEYGCSFTQLMNERRMLAASALLKNSGYSVGEIISILEFESENYFYRMFKNHYGMTPLKYRKSVAKKDD